MRRSEGTNTAFSNVIKCETNPCGSEFLKPTATIRKILVPRRSRKLDEFARQIEKSFEVLSVRERSSGSSAVISPKNSTPTKAERRIPKAMGRRRNILRSLYTCLYTRPESTRRDKLGRGVASILVGNFCGTGIGVGTRSTNNIRDGFIAFMAAPLQRPSLRILVRPTPAPGLNFTAAHSPRRLLGFQFPGISGPAFAPAAGSADPSRSPRPQRFFPQALPSLPVPLRPSNGNRASERYRNLLQVSETFPLSIPSCTIAA